MPISFDEILEYGRDLSSKEECSQLSRRFREYSQVSPTFRRCWDYFNALNNEQKELALETLEASLTILIKRGLV